MARLSRIGALKLTDPDQWKREIKTAMSESKGRVDDAAAKLGISARQLFRWLLLEELQGIKRAENGLPRDGVRGRRRVVVIPTRRELRAARTKAAS